MTTFKITPRDREILDLLLEGCSNKEIGTTLGIAPRTVKQHIRVLCLRAGISTNTNGSRVKLALMVSGQSLLGALPDQLTPAEQAIVRLVCLGLTNGEVSAQVNVSEQMVKNHLRHVYDKLGVWSRLELVMRLTVPNEVPSTKTAHAGL